MKQATLLLLSMLAMMAVADARPMFIHHHPCLSGGGGSYSAGFIDDRTGISYLVVRDCFGHTCVYPLYGPFQPRIAARNDWSTPENLDELIREAGTITGSGEYVGIWVVDTVSGDTLRFRNPAGDAEREDYLKMWMENEEGVDDGAAPGAAFSRLLEESYRDDRARETVEEGMKRELVERYWEKRFGKNGWPSSDQMQPLLDAVAMITDNGSNIVVVQPPSPLNGETLVMAPLLPELSGPATIHDPSGGEIWRGELAQATAVRLDHLPAGLYIIRGFGRDIPIPLVR